MPRNDHINRRFPAFKVFQRPSCWLAVVLISSSLLRNLAFASSYDMTTLGRIPILVDQPEARFKPLGTNDLIGWQQDLVWRDPQMFLQPAALPTVANAKASYFLRTSTTPNDLIQLVWTYNGTRLRLVRNRNVAELSVPIIGGVGQQSKSTELLVDSIIRTGGAYVPPGTRGYKPEHFDLKLPWPAVLKNGQRFSTNPHRLPVLMIHWYSRVDAFVRGSNVVLKFYVRPDVYTSSVGLAPDTDWLGRPFPYRQRLHALLGQP